LFPDESLVVRISKDLGGGSGWARRVILRNFRKIMATPPPRPVSRGEWMMEYPGGMKDETEVSE
jgi:hypothetical protein